jgi:hypothetical protein
MNAYAEARMLGMTHEEAEHEARLAAHSVAVPAGTQPKTGRVATCERCGEAVESIYVVPARRWRWAHRSDLTSPMARRRVAGLLPGKVLS